MDGILGCHVPSSSNLSTAQQSHLKKVILLAAGQLVPDQYAQLRMHVRASIKGATVCKLSTNLQLLMSCFLVMTFRQSQRQYIQDATSAQGTAGIQVASNTQVYLYKMCNNSIDSAHALDKTAMHQGPAVEIFERKPQYFCMHSSPILQRQSLINQSVSINRSVSCSPFFWVMQK